MFDLVNLIKTVGYLGLFGIVFAESGILAGFFLPGDSLLFTAGFLASQEYLNLGFLIGVIFIGAVTGDSFGYAFGRKVGPAIFKREDSRFFRKEYIERASKFYEKHGGKTIILARFIPVVRTFAPVLAGVGGMKYSRFLLYNVVGGAVWTVSLSALGYYLGSTVPGIDKYILPIVGLIILLSISPGIIHLFRKRNSTGTIKNTPEDEAPENTNPAQDSR